ncbi:hypothetical protein FPZ43_09870 [Mucilaginibacter pallidiroseus]|uniref:Uncharacterized protein n=1 Tax=Mucilaginibacter pallidiroseus TaxID=2599295 RepID=A0A563UD53_9SPHI|nr:hypothetical protein [Mucilaginibacter pallidiroseus]TWR29264.1 hypothetical protein FPZ43_09870 [Mucilaginibacter pallidiroseus]
MRKFTFAHLEIRKLSFSDLLWLFVFICVVVALFAFEAKGVHKNAFIVLFGGQMGIAYLVLTTQFGLRFRSAHFSLFWFILSLLFLRVGIPISFLSISLFVLYHLLRFIFFLKYGREFIPFNLGRGFQFYRQVDNIERQGGTNHDKDFMKLLAIVGFAILIACL